MYIKFVQIAQISILIIQHFFKIKIVTRCQEYETIFIQDINFLKFHKIFSFLQIPQNH